MKHEGYKRTQEDIREIIREGRRERAGGGKPLTSHSLVSYAVVRTYGALNTYYLVLAS